LYGKRALLLEAMNAMDIDLSELSIILLFISCLFLSGPAFLVIVVILFYYQMKEIIGERLRSLERSKRYSG
jgi:hypothetical protein